MGRQGEGWGFDTFLNFAVKFPTHGQTIPVKCTKISPPRVATGPYTDRQHWQKIRLAFSLFPFISILQYLKTFKSTKTLWINGKFRDKTVKFTHLSMILDLVDIHHSMISRRRAHTWRGKNNVGLGLFRWGRRSNIPTLSEDRFKYPLPRERKISQKSHPRDNNHNQIPTPCPASPPPPPPPIPAGFKLIDALSFLG